MSEWMNRWNGELGSWKA